MIFSIKWFFINAFILVGSSFSGYSQQEFPINTDKKISLEELLKLANKNSLDAFKAKNKYANNYWQFKSYKSSLLPSLTLETEPIRYRSSVVERYDSQLNQDVFRSIKTLNSNAGLSLSQNILATGGTISLNSTFNKLTNYSDDNVNRYNVVPINIALYQPILAHNRLKWNMKTASLEYEKSKKELVYDIQGVNAKLVDYFFKWLLAFEKKKIALQKEQISKKLYDIAKKRYNIGSIEKDDVLNLELEVFNAKNDVAVLKNNLVKAKNNLSLFLRNELGDFEVPLLKETLLGLKIDRTQALNLYKKNNPKILDLAIKKIEIDRDLDQVVKNNRFDLSLTAGYGFNQQSDGFIQAYTNLLEQERVSLTFKIPLLDWGERKRNIRAAKKNKLVQDLDLDLEESNLIQLLEYKILEFNIQEELVLGSLRASDIAKESYEITEKRFLSGSVDLLRLTSALKAWQSANENYIAKISVYWKYYYEIQQYTLYDFVRKKELDIDLDKGILD